jgi:hypothetical protein
MRLEEDIISEEDLALRADAVAFQGELADVLAGEPDAVERRRGSPAAEDEGADGQVELVDLAGIKHQEVQLSATFQQEMANSERWKSAKDLDHVDATRLVSGNDLDSQSIASINSCKRGLRKTSAT